jgi:hypothetical protein
MLCPTIGFGLVLGEVVIVTVGVAGVIASTNGTLVLDATVLVDVNTARYW